MNIRTRVCVTLSKRLMSAVEERTVYYGAPEDWHSASLSRSWSAFVDSAVTGKDVLDFGCGDGQLSFFLATEKHPRRLVGVDVNAPTIQRARAHLRSNVAPEGVQIDVVVSSNVALLVPDQSIDSLLAFDRLEHDMSPAQIRGDCYQVLGSGVRPRRADTAH